MRLHVATLFLWAAVVFTHVPVDASESPHELLLSELSKGVCNTIKSECAKQGTYTKEDCAVHHVRCLKHLHKDHRRAL